MKDVEVAAFSLRSSQLRSGMCGLVSPGAAERAMEAPLWEKQIVQWKCLKNSL